MRSYALLMGRGNNSTYLIENDSVQFWSETVDETPFFERWYNIKRLLQGNQEFDKRFGYISVEAAPKKFVHDEKWEYRAQVVLRAENHLGTPFKLGYGDTPEQAVQAALESGLSDNFTDRDIKHVFEKPAMVGFSPTMSAQDWQKLVYNKSPNARKADLESLVYRDKNSTFDSSWRREGYYRYKPVVNPREEEIIYLKTHCMTSEIKPGTGPGSDTETRYSYSYSGIMSNESEEVGEEYYDTSEDYSYLQRVPANFHYHPEQKVYIIAKQTRTGDTHSYYEGKQEALFAFDNRDAALEYAGYQLTQLPNSYFDSGEIVLIEVDGTSATQDVLDVDNLRG